MGLQGHSPGSPSSSTSRWFLDHSRIRIQVLDVFLDPGVAGISTDIQAFFGEKDDATCVARAAGLIMGYHKIAGFRWEKKERQQSGAV